MISIGELIILLAYIAMAGYIVYLQDKLKKAERMSDVMSMVLRDVVNGDVTITKSEDGFHIHKQGD